MLGKNISPRDCPEPEGGYKDFRIGELFEIKKGKRLTKSDMIPGEINFIGATDSNNGKTASIANNTHIHPANTITVTYNGSVGKAFYQIAPYWASDDVNVLYPKIDMDESLALYFLAPLIKKGRQYAYSYKWAKEKMESDIIQLPINILGKIDFDFMRLRVHKLKKECMHGLEAYFKAAGFENCTLTEQEKNSVDLIETGKIEMKTMRIVDEVFNVKNSHNILKSDVVFGSGSVPYVTASEGNNSIVSYISYNDDEKEEGNTILIGGKTLVITYQPQAFFSNDSHNLVLSVLNNDAREENVQLYLVASLYKSLSHKYSWGNSISKQKIQSDTINLPVLANGEIDYQLMATYIRAVKKQCIARLKEEIDREQKVYNLIVNDK